MDLNPGISQRGSRQAIGRLACQVATDRLTATRQLSCLPRPQYWRATPTEWLACGDQGAQIDCHVYLALQATGISALDGGTMQTAFTGELILTPAH